MSFSLPKLWDFLQSRLFPSAGAAWMRGSLIIAFILLLATGPNFQVYLVALITSDSAAIYESAYQTDLIQFPSLSDWFQAALYWPFIVAASVVVIYSFWTQSYRKTIELIAISSFLILTLIDAGMALFSGHFSSSDLFQNIIANLLGGMALGFTAALMLAICEYTAKIFSGRASRAVSGATAIAFGILLFTAAYYALDLFYRPLPVRIAMVLSHPAHGSLITDATAPNPNEKSDDPRFSFVPEITTNGFANWRKGDGPMTVRWAALGTPATFDAEITFFDGCADRADLPKAASAPNKYELPNVRSLEFWVDSGLWDLNVFGNGDTSSGKFKFSPQEFVFFSTDKKASDGSIELEEFIKEKSTLTYESSDSISYYALVTPFVVDNDTVVVRPTTLHVKIDGKENQLRLSVDKPDKNWNKPLKCKQISARSILPRGSLDMSSMSLLGVLVTLKPRLGEVYVNSTHAVMVDGDNGWVTIKGMKSAELNHGASGRAEGILVGGGLTSIDINGKAEITNAADNFDAVGEFKGSYDTLGQIRFSGIARLLWKDEIRANPTKWETLDGEQRGYLIALAVAVLSFASGLVVVRWRKGDPLQV
ncbi:hypothetical protein [Mesorhizobium loti]|uniref:hypothetical protein n=1 Tax=Rhizobium loti TaxID=381 RepID=UPI0012690E58|nr:hypothetical protein [Mesorhizobium loti]